MLTISYVHVLTDKISISFIVLNILILQTVLQFRYANLRYGN